MLRFPLIVRPLVVVLALAVILAACGGSSGPGGTVIPPPGSTAKLYFSQIDNPNGLYLIDMATGAATLVGSGITGVTGNNAGLTDHNNTTTLIGSVPGGLNTIATDGSSATSLNPSTVAEGLAYYGATGFLYAVRNIQLVQLDPTTGDFSAFLTNPSVDLDGLACDEAGGLLYAVGNDSHLWRYNIGGMTWTDAGDTGRLWPLSGLAFDHANNLLYAVSGADDNLWRIDPNTATATVVGPTGINVMGGGLAWVPAQQP